MASLSSLCGQPLWSASLTEVHLINHSVESEILCITQLFSQAQYIINCALGKTQQLYFGINTQREGLPTDPFAALGLRLL